MTVVFPRCGGDEHHQNSGVDIPISPEMADKAARRTVPADKAARIILDGMERNAYRVMVGSDAKLMDRALPAQSAACRRVHRQPDEVAAGHLTVSDRDAAVRS